MELASLREAGQGAYECVDNDETAAVIAGLVHAKTLVILTSTEGIYRDPKDPSTLVREVSAKDPGTLEKAICALQSHCKGASRAYANGAFAKLEYIKKPAMQGTEVHIGHARHRISDLLSGKAPHTRIALDAC
jgi:glutamate 5-kinase